MTGCRSVLNKSVTYRHMFWVQALETNRREQCHHAACVIAQECLSATVSVFLHCRKENMEEHFKNCCCFNFLFFKTVKLKLA